MRTLPEGISVGDRLSQGVIEEAFDTEFGCRISGINPRRDSQDCRDVLLFTNDDGPYDDSVTRGRFEYIGEGLEATRANLLPGTPFS
ncbi:oxidoreductase [Haloferax sp. CBA1150]|nr:oxidoreductase [Haloferax sp. CBA1150]